MGGPPDPKLGNFPLDKLIKYFVEYHSKIGVGNESADTGQFSITTIRRKRVETPSEILYISFPENKYSALFQYNLTATIDVQSTTIAAVNNSHNTVHDIRVISPRYDDI